MSLSSAPKVSTQRASLGPHSEFSYDSNRWSSDEEGDCSCKDGLFTCLRRWVCDNVLAVLIMAGVVLGMVVGVALRWIWDTTNAREIWYLEFPGRVLVNSFKLMSVPLIFTSVARAMCELDKAGSNKIGLAALVYSVCSSLSAATLGAVLAMTLKPGNPHHSDDMELTEYSFRFSHLDVISDMIRAVFPDNILTVVFQRTYTVFQAKTIYEFDLTTNKHVKLFRDWKRSSSLSAEIYNLTVESPKNVTRDGTNMFGLIFISMTIGILMSRMDNGEPVKDLISSVNDLVLKAIRILIWYTPIGVMFIIAGKFLRSGSFEVIWEAYAYLLFTTLLGLAIHGIYILPTVFYLLTWRSPVALATRQLRALMTAWGTSSSYATLPVTMDCLLDKNSLNRQIVNLVAPIGTTFNKDGSALNQVIIAIYVAQIYGIYLSYGEIIILSLVSTLASSTSAALPSTHPSNTYLMVLGSVGLPTGELHLVYGVDWLLDRFRTVVNVWGDAIGASILDHYYGNTLNERSSRISGQKESIPMAMDRENVQETIYNVGNRPPANDIVIDIENGTPLK